MFDEHCRSGARLRCLALNRPDRALAAHDRHIRGNVSCEVSDLIDASALLWRVELAGAAAGLRWASLAAAWAAHIGDAYCSFNDLHAMLSFVGARDWHQARRLEDRLLRSAAQTTRHGQTTRLPGLDACRALLAYGHGDLSRPLPPRIAPSQGLGVAPARPSTKISAPPAGL